MPSAKQVYDNKNYPFTMGVPHCFSASFVSVHVFCLWLTVPGLSRGA